MQASKLNELDIFSGSRELPDGVALRVILGALELWLTCDGEEWAASYNHDLSAEDRPTTFEILPLPQEDRTWTRWILGATSRTVTLQPATPDSPLVVRPSSPVCLLRGQSAVFYVGIPMWLAVHAGTPPVKLCEIPSMKLSKSWFGSPTDGELCYAMRTRATVRYSGLMPRMHRVVCPMQFRNLSDDSLMFERVCLRCSHLRIYSGKHRLWTNPVRFTYRGRNEWSRVIYSPGGPGMDEATNVLAEARIPAGRGILQKSFKYMLSG